MIQTVTIRCLCTWFSSRILWKNFCTVSWILSKANTINYSNSWHNSEHNKSTLISHIIGCLEVCDWLKQTRAMKVIHCQCIDNATKYIYFLKDDKKNHSTTAIKSVWWVFHWFERLKQTTSLGLKQRINIFT